MSSPSPDAQVLATAALHLAAGKYFQIAAFVMLVYDQILTFPDEVERIWKQNWSGATILFLINRYVTPLQFIVGIDAFQDPIWTKSACDRFVAFEGSSTVAMVAVCEMIMILRVYALYGRSRLILAFLLFLWVAQVTLSSIGMRTGFAVPLPPGFVGCIFSSASPLFPALWVTPLVTDCCIFFLTLWRTRTFIRRSRRTPTIHLFLRDGLMYFLVIFMANLLNTLIFFLGPSDLKAVGASFSQLITATMISRLVLNLRSLSYVSDSHDAALLPSRNIDTHVNVSAFVARTIGNLGEDMETFLDFSEKGDDIPLKKTDYRSQLNDMDTPWSESNDMDTRWSVQPSRVLEIS